MEHLEEIKQELKSNRELTHKLLNVVESGFKEVNERLSLLEGHQGMKGVHTQLDVIKDELQKIRTAYPYDGLNENMRTITGTA